MPKHQNYYMTDVLLGTVAEATAPLHLRIAELETALQLHLDFLASLPSGWLGKTVADIGLLNDAYIASRRLGMKVDR